jgi:hypothetical protein
MSRSRSFNDRSRSRGYRGRFIVDRNRNIVNRGRFIINRCGNILYKSRSTHITCSNSTSVISVASVITLMVSVMFTALISTVTIIFATIRSKAAIKATGINYCSQ